MSDCDPRIVIFAATSLEHRLFPATPGIETVQTGMGDAAAADAFQRALRLRMSGAVSFGFAGALVPDLPCGSLLLPRAVRDLDGGRLETDPLWHERVLSALAQAGLSADARDITQVGQILDGERTKTAVAHRTLAMAADMESGALATKAMAHGIPFLVLRVVLDEIGDDLPACLGRAVSADGNVASARLLGSLLREPSALRPLFRLALRRKVAAASLQRAAQRAELVRGLPAPAPGSE